MRACYCVPKRLIYQRTGRLAMLQAKSFKPLVRSLLFFVPATGGKINPVIDPYIYMHALRAVLGFY